MENIGKMARLQKELLESAVHAAKVGGRIVYSTCTLTPEENEEVIASVVKKFEGKLEVIDPSAIVGEWSKAGVEDALKVQGGSGNPVLRLWPQTYDTEGFFSAVLQKVASTKDRVFKDQPTHKYPFVQKTRMREIAERLTDWYGTSFLREDEVLIESKEQLLVLPSLLLEKYIPLLPYFSGLPFGKYTSHGLPRLSHELTTLRGGEATKQVLHLAHADLKRVFAGVNVESVVKALEDGDVMLGLEDNAVGRTMIFGRGVLKNGIILNRLPREIVKMFT
jgi:16S rRNA (cytosine1407-C5)-methyltransferase